MSRNQPEEGLREGRETLGVENHLHKDVDGGNSTVCAGI